MRAIEHKLSRCLVMALLVLTGGVLVSEPAAAVSRAPANECTPNPGRSLVVATVPRVEGFAFQVGDRRYRTGPSGSVRIEPVTCPAGEEAMAPITDTVDQGGGTTARFDAWYGAELLDRDRGDGTLYAAFGQRVRVDFELVDLDGRPVARDVVGGIVVKGSTGAELEVPRGTSSVELDASRVVRFSNGLVSKDILWSVQSVDVEGNTAVNRGQVRFEPRRTRTVTVPLMLYTLRVAVRDAVLHRSVGDQVTLTSPDGSQRTITLDPDSTGEVAALARGHYVLRASGPSIALGFEQPVAVSRPQVADLSVISYLDLAIAGAAFLSVVIGLLIVGWRLRRRHRADEVHRHADPSHGPMDAAAVGPVVGPTHKKAAT